MDSKPAIATTETADRAPEGAEQIKSIVLEGPGRFNLAKGAYFIARGFATMHSSDGHSMFGLVDGSRYGTPFGHRDSPNWVVVLGEEQSITLDFIVKAEVADETLVTRVEAGNSLEVQKPRGEVVAGVEAQVPGVVQSEG